MAKNQSVFQKNPAMIVTFTYFIMLAVNLGVLYLAQMFFPKMIVLGTMSMDSLWAMFHSMGKLSLILTLVMPFFQYAEGWLGRKLKPMDWMVGYYVVNFVALWAITRFSDQFGLGVTSWMVIAALAFVMDMVQGMAMMWFGKMTGSNG